MLIYNARYELNVYKYAFRQHVHEEIIAQCCGAQIKELTAPCNPNLGIVVFEGVKEGIPTKDMVIDVVQTKNGTLTIVLAPSDVERV